MILQISAEGIVALLGLILTLIISTVSGMWAIWNKLDKVWKAIGDIREDYVKEQSCETKRKECPCKLDWADFKDIRNRLKSKINSK